MRSIRPRPPPKAGVTPHKEHTWALLWGDSPAYPRTGLAPQRGAPPGCPATVRPPEGASAEPLCSPFPISPNPCTSFGPSAPGGRL